MYSQRYAATHGRHAACWSSACVILAFVAGCGPSAPSDNDGVGVIFTPDAGEAGAIGCTGTDEGCPCSAEGATTSCPSPKIPTTHGYICPPGVRVCQGGSWGACIPTQVEAISSQTEDYSSSCLPGTHVSWGSLVIQGQTPGDSSVAVGVQSADTTEELNAQTYQLVAAYDSASQSPWTVDVAGALTATGHPSASMLRLTLLLMPSQAAQMPTVTWNQAQACVPDP